MANCVRSGATSGIDRALIERAVEALVDLLDHLDGDPDFEADPMDEQHDVEADLTWASQGAPPWFHWAETARQKAL